jgi:hypothetical protein
LGTRRSTRIRRRTSRCIRRTVVGVGACPRRRMRGIHCVDCRRKSSSSRATTKQQQRVPTLAVRGGKQRSDLLLLAGWVPDKIQTIPYCYCYVAMVAACWNSWNNCNVSHLLYVTVSWRIATMIVKKHRLMDMMDGKTGMPLQFVALVPLYEL